MNKVSIRKITNSLSKNYKSGVLPVLAVVFTLSIGTAWSYENSNVSRETLYVPPLVSAEQCNPLLNSAQNSPDTFGVDEDQRKAGKVAALGLILGVRFALEPTGTNQATVPSFTKETSAEVPQERSAQAIISYRKCLKDQALSKLALKH